MLGHEGQVKPSESEVNDGMKILQGEELNQPPKYESELKV